jgi:predicted RNase H-like HicB family nuclease
MKRGGRTFRFLVVIERATHNYSAYSPDLPGCVATGRTKKVVERRIQEAIELHIRGLIEDGQSIPPTNAVAEYVAISKRVLTSSTDST